jgi:hypothetical protein
MRKSSITIILLFCYFLSIGQNKVLSIPISSKGDTTNWYKWIQKYTCDNGLQDLTVSKDSLHFRVSTVSETVDVWTNDYKAFKGTITAFIKCSKSNQPETFKTYSKPIDDSTAKRIYQIVNSNQIFEIPTDKEITGWNQGFDGIEILIEHSTPTLYDFKEYWTPSMFPEIKDAKIIDTVQRQVWTILYKIKFSTNLLSNGCTYLYNGVPGIPIKPYKKRQKSR